MSDWINSMKSKDDDAARQAQNELGLRLHRAEVIRAKAPIFWESLMDSLKSDCIKLAEMFPNDLSRHCRFTSDDKTSCTLQGNTDTRDTLRLTFSVQSMSIRQQFLTGMNVREKSDSSLEFDLGDHEELFLRGISGKICLPEIAAECLIKRVIRAS